MAFLLAVDQGSTKTAALVGDDAGRILGVGYAGGACHSSDGMDMAMSMVRSACGEAMRQAGASAADIALLVGGLTGADWDYEYPLLEDALIRTIGVPSVRVCNDCVIAQRGGTDAGHGVVLCAGTAFNAAVQTPDGGRFIFGYYVNDEDMGGTSIGKAAVVAVCNAHAGIGPPTRLTGLVLGFYRVPTVDELLFRRINGKLRPYKDAAPLVFEAARAGDPAAVGILERHGESVARYAIAGLRRIGDAGLRTDVVLSGSIFKAKDRILQRSIAGKLAMEAPQANVVDALYEPVVGAYLLGLDEIRGAKFPMRGESLLKSASRFDLLRMANNKEEGGNP
ncbi:N-acetylglucosamine kinase [Cohnella caldifontis]|uniref:N-acetylglucosamine kinase n=1 Tax=Cohnella caldifontis TaxID=3027471 RepID=UPI0023ECE954|nr:BadF/BadG/BcrA/BcrD ATPase family protein [Cohnella sp. YIM B05605]